MPRRILRGSSATILIIASVLAASAGHAQDGPTAERITEIVEGSIPPWWSIGDLEVVSTSDIGDAITPRRAVRFEVTSRNEGPLYAETNKAGPFAVIVPTVPEPADRTLYGVLVATYHAGTWSGEVTIENPVAGLGQPRDQFATPTLIAGDPASEQMLTSLSGSEIAALRARQELEISALETGHAERVSALKAAHAEEIKALGVGLAEEKAKAEADIASLRSRHGQEMSALETAHSRRVSELRMAQAEEIKALDIGLAEAKAQAEARHAKAMSELAASQAGDLEDLKTAHATALAEADAAQQKALIEKRVAYEADLARLTEGLEPDVAEARRLHAEALAGEKERHATEIAGERDRHAREMDDLRARHAASRGSLIETQRQEIAELETQLGTELRSLQTQLDSAEEVVALQQELLARLAQRKAGAEQLLAAFEDARKARRDFFARLPTEWKGQVVCQSEDKTSVSFTLPVSSFTIENITAEGFSGDYFSSLANRGQFSMVMEDEGFAFPMPLRLRMESSEFPQTLVMSLTQDGRIVGQAPYQWKKDNRAIPGSCQIKLAS